MIDVKRWGVIVAGVMLGLLPAMGAETEPAADSARGNANVRADRSSRPTVNPGGDAKIKRMREGTTLVDANGSFRARGDRYWFRENDTGREFRVLENLALERISRTLGNQSENRLWMVSGNLTEYHGENFLFLTRAMLRSQSSSPATGGGE